ncbi:MAG: adenylate/guanylate cyclase domain-containing protein [Syntrophomonas sp.]
MNGYIIFSDLKGYSKMSENEIRIFFEKVNLELSQQISVFLNRAQAFNTWGDAVVAVFQDGKEAVDMVLTYRDFFNSFEFEALDMRRLMPRIGGHFGEFNIFKDQLLGRINMYGSNINTAARIEPVTRTGEIFVTRQFKEALENLPSPLDYIKFDELGFVELAKNFGEWELFRLYRRGEKAQVIDKIFAMDLSAALPPPPVMNAEEEELISHFAGLTESEAFLDLLTRQDLSFKSGEFIYRLAGICKNFGLYRHALDYINMLENHCYIETYGLKMHPYKNRQDLLKLKANCLTRIGQYDIAADIVYSLWQMGLKDSDTLSMLAAQYKRRALFGEESRELKENIDTELLVKSKDLYLEAFRRNIDDYYPAINAAYLYRYLGENESENGIKLAKYVLDSWLTREGENWWMDSTLAEAELLQDFFTASYLTFERALQIHNPDSFERSSTVEQISTYAKITGKEADLADIINLLSPD